MYDRVGQQAAFQGIRMEAKRRLGFVLLGGATTGAQVRDVRLINELVRRGHQCFVWWGFERDYHSRLDPRVEQRWLFHHARYASYSKLLPFIPGGNILDDFSGRIFSRVGGRMMRDLVVDRFPGVVDHGLQGMIRQVCRGVGQDRRLIDQFAHELTATGVSHVFPMLAVLAPFVLAAAKQTRQKVDCTVTFQGYELYSLAARQVGLEAEFYHKLKLAVAESGRTPVTVSRPYAERIESEVGIRADDFRIIPPGIPEAKVMDRDKALEILRQETGVDFTRKPVISFLGRIDSEKGVDLLLMAARLLKQRNIDARVVICGAAAFGTNYRTACRQISGHLGLDVCWRGFVSNEVRTALMQESYCLVYPSIHHEPFGMVPVEAMSHGTPVVVSDTGGVAELVRWNDLEGGITFRSWDSGDLAVELERLLTNTDHYDRLRRGTQSVASHYTIGRMTDELLDLVDNESLAAVPQARAA